MKGSNTAILTHVGEHAWNEKKKENTGATVSEQAAVQHTKITRSTNVIS